MGPTGLLANYVYTSYEITSKIDATITEFRWGNSSFTNYDEFIFYWSSSAAIDLDRVMNWGLDPELVVNDLVFSYGESPARIYLLLENSPVQGYVIGELLEPATEQSGRLIMRFNNPDKVCYWGFRED